MEISPWKSLTRSARSTCQKCIPSEYIVLDILPTQTAHPGCNKQWDEAVIVGSSVRMSRRKRRRRVASSGAVDDSGGVCWY
uniref:Uncharacterized protein n=1 Tax=Vespula pensylvanica TaxID=30213 RepID=A0A834PB79_VESPE|nr:hypothetical protein H0235_002984 [Vespula pensylvanica]